MTTITDNFNRADSSTSAGPNWVQRGAHTVGINNNAACREPGVADWCLTSHATPMTTNDMEASIVLGPMLGDGGSPHVLVGLGLNDAGEGAFIYNGGDTALYFYHHVTWQADWSHQSTAFGATTPGTGDKITLRRIGNTYYVLLNDVEQGSWPDTGNIIPRDSSHRLVEIGCYSTNGTNGRTIDSFNAVDAAVAGTAALSGEGTLAATATAITGGFTPTDISGLSVWLDASQLTGADDSSIGSQWTDLSGAGHHGAVILSPAPVVKTAVLNGKRVVRFTADEGAVRINSGRGSPHYDMTLIYITRMISGTPNRIAGSVFPPYNLIVGAHSSGWKSCYDNGWVNTGEAWPTLPTDWVVFSFTSMLGDGTTPSQSYSRFWVDGVESGYAPGNGWDNTYAISGYGGSSGEETSTCEVAEYIVYNRKLSDAERFQVEDYLNAKWFGAEPSAWGSPEQMVSTATPPNTFSGDYTLAVKFTPTADGRVTHIRAWLGAGTHTFSLWDNTTQAQLGTTTTAVTGSSAWRVIELPTPVNVVSGTRYVATASTDGAEYGYTGTWPTSLTPHLIDLAGAYAAGPDVFPTDSDANYHYVDVVYQQQLGAGPPSEDVTASLAGAGTLSGTGSESYPSVPALSGAGALSATTKKVALISAAFSGGGTLTAPVRQSFNRTASLGGGGALTAPVNPGVTASLPLSGGGVLSATAKLSFERIAAFLASGDLTETLTPIVPSSVVRTSEGTLVVTTKAVVPIAVAFNGGGTLVAPAIQLTAGTIPLSGNGVLSVTVVPGGAAPAALSGAGILSAPVKASFDRMILLAGGSAMTATITPRTTSAAVLSGSGSLSATIKPRYIKTVNLFSTGQLMATAVLGGAVEPPPGAWNTAPPPPGRVYGPGWTTEPGLTQTISRGGWFAVLEKVAPLRGEGALVAVMAPRYATGVPLGGAGALVPVLNPRNYRTMPLSGLGLPTAEANRTVPLNILFNGGGDLTRLPDDGLIASVTEGYAARFSGGSDLNTPVLGGRGFVDGLYADGWPLYPIPDVGGGTGTITALISQRYNIPMALSGGGTLSATAVAVAEQRVAALSGAGALTAVPDSGHHYTDSFSRSVQNRTVGLAGGGALSAPVTAKYAQTAALSGGGVLSASAVSLSPPVVVGTPAFAGATTVALPTHAPGDMIILVGGSSSTAPTIPSAGGTVPTWATIVSISTGHEVRVVSAIATASNHTSGTWTNAQALAAIVLRRSTGGTPTLGAAVKTATGDGVSANSTAPALTLQNSSGSSFILCVHTLHNATWAAAPAGYTRQVAGLGVGAAGPIDLCLNSKDVTTTASAVSQGSQASNWFSGAQIEIKD